MKSNRTTAIANWIAFRFRQHVARGTPMRGTYGLVWLLDADDERMIPPGFALKTFDGEKQMKGLDRTIEELFERELGLWLRLPGHTNVLRALGLEFAVIEGENQDERVPMVRMELMDGSLKDWVGKDEPSRGERLMALAQTCNGLSWMYEHGIESHADLKPDNVLFRDLSSAITIPKGHPRWMVRVADLGWADVWRDIEGADVVRRAYRPYLAPERLAGTMVPIASDMFAFGVIAVELLCGRHPAGHPTDRIGKWDDAKYLRWATAGERKLDVELPDSLNAALLACLSPSPATRPHPRQVLEHLARTLANESGLDPMPLLDHWTSEARKMVTPSSTAWSAGVAADLGGHQLGRSIVELTREHEHEPLPTAVTTTAQWLASSQMLAWLLLRRDEGNDQETAGDVALRVLRFLVTYFDVLQLRHEYDPELEPHEVAGYIADEALRLLKRAGRAESNEVKVLTHRLRHHWDGGLPSIEELLKAAQTGDDVEK